MGGGKKWKFLNEKKEIIKNLDLNAGQVLSYNYTDSKKNRIENAQQILLHECLTKLK